MPNTVKIDNYFDGFIYSQIDCEDIPLAGTAGAYNHDNYFFYCFYVSVYYNWCEGETKDKLKIRDEIFNRLGLSLVPYKIDNTKELLTFIKNSVDKSMPLFLLASYSTLYYTPNYLVGQSKTHGVIINGYDSEKSVIIMTDTMPFDNSPMHLKANPLYTMYVKEKIMEDIWVEVMDFFEKENSPNANIIYRVERANEPIVSSYYDLLSDFLNNYNFDTDKLALFVKNFNQNKKEYLGNIDYYRKEFYGSLQAFFRSLEYLFADIDKDDNDIIAFMEFKDRYLKFRSEVLFVVHMSAIRGISFDEDKINLHISEINSMNSELMKHIVKLHKRLSNAIPDGLINYALGKHGYADSELQFGEDMLKASQAFNGKCQNWLTDMWISDNKEQTHWLVVDLAEPRKVHKIVVVHSGEQHTTVDFKIYGSIDNSAWFLISSTEGNKEVVTTHEFEPCTYRYIKIYITNPGSYDFNARICELEVWGYQE